MSYDPHTLGLAIPVTSARPLADIKKQRMYNVDKENIDFFYKKCDKLDGVGPVDNRPSTD